MYLFSELHYFARFRDIPFIPLSLGKALALFLQMLLSKNIKLCNPLLYFSEFSYYFH